MKQTFLLLTILSFFQVSIAQYESQIKYLDEYYQKAVQDFALPSMSVALVKDGKVILMKSYGVLKNGEKKKADENSIYGIASLSKAFTTACLGMLVDEGKLKWDDKVVDHLPYFQLHDTEVSNRMTIRDLCSHRAGLATFDGDLLWYATDYSREEIVRRIRYLPLKQEFRTEFGYQNIMYITAGELIEAVSGKTWDAFVEERIFTPLKMDRSYTSFEKIDLKDNMTAPHLDGEPIFHLSYDNSGATAAIHSNVEDLSHWIRFWLNNGIYNGDTLLSTSSINEIHKQQTLMNVGNFDKRNGTHFKGYGLGWFLLDYNGRKVVRHGGGLPGYISQIGLVPEEKLGLIVLTNDMSSLPLALLYKTVDVFTEDVPDGRDWSGEFLGYKQKGKERDVKAKTDRYNKRVAGTNPSHALPAYVGEYEDVMYGGAKVELKDGALQFEMTPSKKLFNATLEHWHFDTFRFEFQDPFLPEGFLTFESDSDGNITGFTIDLPNPDFHFFNLHFKKK
jgi:CubicO group peptidase (beta-lactamase class C family)